jgi:hypothetical protein
MEVKTTVIYRTGKYRHQTLQTVKDDETLEIRKRKIGEQYRLTEQRLEQILGTKLTRQKLLDTANKLYESGVVQHPPDRLCKRKKEALICWFSENSVSRGSHTLTETSIRESDFKLQTIDCLQASKDFDETTAMVPEEFCQWNGDFDDFDE